MSYNGYTNHATWLVSLHFFDMFEGDMPASITSAHDAGQWLRETVDSFISDSGSYSKHGGFLDDLITGTLSDVNWFELGEQLIEDNKDEDDE